MIPMMDWPEEELLETDLGAAYTRVPPDFEGPVLLQLDNKESRTACFPTREEGHSAAQMAIGSLGGYQRALVIPAHPGTPITHASAHDWLFS